ncbi:MAG: hypothetical protein FJ248_01950 [Nitrospira sp.]|nr:hypothetical protein [Nitrospira sp.]
MTSSSTPSSRALYYPFHLCHKQTLARLLDDYAAIHFRDYMALQLTPMSGTTAYNDRMGQFHPQLVTAGRIVQGYSVSGPLDAEITAAVDRDLADSSWRTRFHNGLRDDRRFQRGLFELSHSMAIGEATAPGPSVLLRLLEPARAMHACSVDRLQTLCSRVPSPDESYEYEYVLALVKTSAALAYTIRLCRQHQLEAVTDSPVHFQLLERACTREGISLENHLLNRDGY